MAADCGDQAAELALLEAAVEKAADACPAQPARHRSRTASASSVLNLVARHRAAAAMGDAGDPLASAHRSVATVRSLDQLYMQAVAVAPLLRAAAEQWAAAVQGEVDAAGQRSLEQDGAWARAPWAGEPLIKGAGRAVEKVATCYGGDASRLVGAAGRERTRLAPWRPIDGAQWHV